MMRIGGFCANMETRAVLRGVRLSVDKGRLVADMFGAIWIATAFTSRYSSLSALVASFVTPIFLWFFGHPALASLFAVLTLLLFWTHRENIRRLQTGTEGKIGQK